MSAPAVSITSLLTFELKNDGGVTSPYCSLETGEVEPAAEVVARGIAQRRIGANPKLHALWLKQLRWQSGGELDPSHVELFTAGLLQNVGTPESPAELKHLHGLVAEEIWLEVIAEKDLGLGPPLRVEGHDWSVTDPGGDGLTVHGTREGGGFCFRLWESKYHGSPNPIRDTVNGACRQVKARASSYLSRFSIIAQHLEGDPPLARFYGRLAEMWVDKDPAAGVGIVVGTSGAHNEGVFFDMPRFFDLDIDRHQGQLNTIGDFAGFALKVRDLLWKGCGLWTGH